MKISIRLRHDVKSRCLHCHKPILFQWLAAGQFCSQAHQREHKEEMSMMGLRRLEPAPQIHLSGPSHPTREPQKTAVNRLMEVFHRATRSEEKAQAC